VRTKQCTGVCEVEFKAGGDAEQRWWNTVWQQAGLPVQATLKRQLRSYGHVSHGMSGGGR
jgi:hypothetical protein